MVVPLLAASGTTLRAAGENPQLAGTAWLAEDIGGRGVIDRARSTMEFKEPGQVGGLAGCNRYFGAVTLEGDAISFGNLAATRMMCPEALMDQEQRFLEALAAARRVELTHEGLILLVYADAAEPIIEFSRLDQP
jgi:heat shock protein HslJ